MQSKPLDCPINIKVFHLCSANIIHLLSWSVINHSGFLKFSNYNVFKFRIDKLENQMNGLNYIIMSLCYHTLLSAPVPHRHLKDCCGWASMEIPKIVVEAGHPWIL